MLVEMCILLSRGAFRPRDVRFALENDGWNCTFECEVHVSAPGAPRGSSPRPVLPIPGPAAALFVQICHKSPDRAGAPEGYSGVVLKTWGVKVVVTVRPSGRFPAQPRSAPAGRLAWWDGVSHVVTRPAREHVT